MTHLGDVVFRHVCMHQAHIRARRGYEPTLEAVVSSSPEGRLTAVCRARIRDWSELRTRRQSEKLRKPCVSYLETTETVTLNLNGCRDYS